MKLALSPLNSKRLLKTTEMLSCCGLVRDHFSGDMFGGLDISLNGSAFSFAIKCPQVLRMDLSYAKMRAEAFNLSRGQIDPNEGTKYHGSKLLHLFRDFYLAYVPHYDLLIVSMKAKVKAKYSERDKMILLDDISSFILENPLAVAAELIELQLDVLVNPQNYNITKPNLQKIEAASGGIQYTTNLVDHLKIRSREKMIPLISLEDVNVSSHFSGMKAVAGAFGIVASNISTNPTSGPLWFMMSPKTSMEAYVRRAVVKLSDHLKDMEEVSTQNNRKQSAMSFVRSLTQMDVVDDDITDSVCHLLMACEVYLLSIHLQLYEITDEMDVPRTYKLVKHATERDHCFSNIESITSVLKGSYSRTKVNYDLHA